MAAAAAVANSNSSTIFSFFSFYFGLYTAAAEAGAEKISFVFTAVNLLHVTHTHVHLFAKLVRGKRKK